ncbi:MAG TPA: septum formation initiator family protein [Acidimicrobiales bacterium]
MVVRAPDGSVVDPGGRRRQRSEQAGPPHGPAGGVPRRANGAGGLVYGAAARDRAAGATLREPGAGAAVGGPGGERGPGVAVRQRGRGVGRLPGTSDRQRARGRSGDRRRPSRGRSGTTGPRGRSPAPRAEVDRSIAPADAQPVMTRAPRPRARTGRPAAERPAGERRTPASARGLREARGAPFAYGVVADPDAPDTATPATPPGGVASPVRSSAGGPGGHTGDGEVIGEKKQRRRRDTGRPRVASALGRLRLGDRLRGPGGEARERRRARIRKLGLVVGAVALVVALVGVLVYAVFPVRTVLDQWNARNRGEEQLEVLTRENERLERRIGDLRDPETIEEMARREYGYARPGEESYSVAPPPRAGDG